ncbi:MAG: hypothetical protein L6R35_006918, partial [Caloplaca aegaea]
HGDIGPAHGFAVLPSSSSSALFSGEYRLVTQWSSPFSRCDAIFRWYSIHGCNPDPHPSGITGPSPDIFFQYRCIPCAKWYTNSASPIQEIS